MADRAAIVTGASRGIGLALAETLGEEGYGLTLTARKPETIEQTAHALRERGYEVEYLAANMGDEEAIREVVRLHRDRFGRLDVLANNAGGGSGPHHRGCFGPPAALVNTAGVGSGSPAGEHQTKFVDLQLGVNLRAIVL